MAGGDRGEALWQKERKERKPEERRRGEQILLIKKNKLWLALLLLVPTLLLSGCDETVVPVTIPDTDTLEDIGCTGDGEIVQWNTTINDWECTTKAAGGGGDITAVTTDGLYLSGGATSGQVDLLFNSAEMNATIRNITDSRDDTGANTTSQMINATVQTRTTNKWCKWDGSALDCTIEPVSSGSNTTAQMLAGANSTGLLLNWSSYISGGSSANITLNLTAGTYNGSQNGYNGTNAICNAEYSGSHLCTGYEIISFISRGTSYFSSLSDSTWYATFSPKYIPASVPVDDCNGFTYDGTTTHLGTYWKWNDNSFGGAGKAINCGTELKLACCKNE